MTGDVHGQRVNVLGLPVAGIAISDAVSIFGDWIAQGAREYVTVTSAHGVVECLRDVELSRIHRSAGLVVPDGMPVVWLARAQGGRRTQRCYGPDLMLATLEASLDKGYRHYFYGGGDGVAELLRTKMTGRFPGLDVVGCYTPPFRALNDAESERIADEINAAAPDFVWVGLSTPKQERWMAAFRSRLLAPVLVGVGAAFDFHAGLKPQAPRFLQRHGLEWAYRLASEPRRLGRRYLVVVPTFLLQAGLQISGLKRFG